MGMTTNTEPTYAQLRLALAQERLAHAETRAAYHMLKSISSATLSAPSQPGPRWEGIAH